VPGIINPYAFYPGTLFSAIQRQGLTSGLKLCFDASDINSYAGSGTTWLDTSGNGYDFVPHASSPGSWSFVGSAGGQSSGEGWHSGVGVFANQEYDSANETWMQNLHKNNAQFTFLRWYKFLSGAGNASAQILSTRASAGSNTRGIQWENASSTELMTLRVYNGTDAQVQVISSGLAATQDAWLFQAASIDEAAGTSAFRQNGDTASPSGTYTSPTSSNATDKLNIHIEEGTLASLAIWEGVALTAAQIEGLYEVTRNKFGV
jgi:hypothetical protein